MPIQTTEPVTVSTTPGLLFRITGAGESASPSFEETLKTPVAITVHLLLQLIKGYYPGIRTQEPESDDSD